MGRPIHDACQFLIRFDAYLQEMLGMLGGRCEGPWAIVHFLFPFARDRMIFDSGKRAYARRGQVGSHVVVIQVEPDVPVEIPITRIPGVTFVFAPDLARRIQVAAERRDAIMGEDRRKYAVARARAAIEQPMRVDDEPPYAGLL